MTFYEQIRDMPPEKKKGTYRGTPWATWERWMKPGGDGVPGGPGRVSCRP